MKSIVEIWRDVRDYEGLYKVSNLGRVKSLERYVKNNICGFLYSKEHILKQSKIPSGYKKVNLSKDGIIVKQYVHRIVAQAFLPNPDNLPEVNHKDENKENNCVDNLEWCSHSYNMCYGSRSEKYSVKVRQFAKDNTLIGEYSSLTEASKATNISCGNISSCIKGRLKTAGGYIWEKLF